MAGADAIVEHRAASLAGFSLQPLTSAADPCWHVGRHADGGAPVLVRRIAGIPFADAIRDLIGAVAMLDTTVEGIAPTLAVLVTSGTAIVAGSAAAAAGFTPHVDAGAAAALSPDAAVDVWAIYPLEGEEVLSDGVDPLSSCDALAAVAGVLDSLSEPHGAIDSVALRRTPGGPLVLAYGLDPLEASRRSRRDTVGPWRTLSPERCLPPGSPSRSSDQYALACLWAARRTGRPTHDATSAELLIREKLTGQPHLDGLKPREREVLARALAATAEDRFGSCNEFVAALRDSLACATPLNPDSAAADPGDRSPGSAAARPKKPMNAADPQPAAPQVPAAGAALVTTAVPPLAPQAAPAPDTVLAVQPAGFGMAETAPVPGDPWPDRVVAGEDVLRPTAPTTAADHAIKNDIVTTLDPSIPADPAAANPPAATPAAPGPEPGRFPGAQIPGVPSRPPAASFEDAPALRPSAERLATAPYRPGDQILPGYVLEILLGQGGFGEVWRASAPGGMRVAIKVIGSLGGKVGTREFRSLSTVKDLKHAHIVPIFGVWLKTSSGRLLDQVQAKDIENQILRANSDSPALIHKATESASLKNLELIIAMGLADQTVYDALKQRQSDDSPGIEPRQLLEWMRQAASAIDYFNRGGALCGAMTDAVHHCDIKPQNILLLGDTVQVCDFGLARFQGQARKTANNLLSIAYAAPEMMVDPYTPRPNTDQYSLAVTYYELRTGRLPYAAGDGENEDPSPVELMRFKIQGEVNLALVPPKEQQILRRALSVTPSDRFDSCEEFIDRLEAAIDADSSPAVPATPTSPLKPWAFAIAAVVAAAAVIRLIPWPDRTPPPPPPPAICPQAREAFTNAFDPDGYVDLEKVSQVAEMARKAVEAGESACSGLGPAADAVREAAQLVTNVVFTGKEIVGFDQAEAAIDAMPQDVPVSIRIALRQKLDGRVQSLQRDLVAAARNALDTAVRDDDAIDAEPLSKALDAAALLKRFDAAEAERLTMAAEAIRAIAAVTSSAAPQPTGLDAAIALWDRITDSLSPRASKSLGRALANRIVDCALARLRDNNLANLASLNAEKIALLMKLVDEAKRDLNEALRLDDESWRAKSDLGLCEILSGVNKETSGAVSETREPYEKAIRSLTEALALLDKAGGDSQHREDVRVVRQRLAYALVRAGHHARAEKEYLSCLVETPELGRALLSVADASSKAGDHALAAEVLERLQTLIEEKPAAFAGLPPTMPELGQALLSVATAASKAGSHGVAAEVLERLQTLIEKKPAAFAGASPTMPELGQELLRVADEASKGGNPAVAAKVLERLQTLLTDKPGVFGGAPPKKMEVLERLAWLSACGFGENPAGRAVPLAEQFLAAANGGSSLGQRLNALDTLAVAFARAGRFQDAIRTIDQAIAAVQEAEQQNPSLAKQEFPDLLPACLEHRQKIAQGQTWDTP